MKGEGNQTFGTTNMVVGGFAVIVCLFVYLFLSSFTSWLWPKGRTLQKCTVDPASKTSRGPVHACPGGWQRRPVSPGTCEEKPVSPPPSASSLLLLFYSLLPSLSVLPSFVFQPFSKGRFHCRTTRNSTAVK